MDARIRAHDKTANALLPQRMRGKLPTAPEPFTVTDAPMIAPGTAELRRGPAAAPIRSI